MTEEWRTIPGLETHEVSNMGRVRSKDRISKVAADGLGGCDRVVNYERKLKGKLLQLHYNRKYYQVSINDHDYSVHRLVAMAFLPPPEAGRNEINHKDGNKLNNVVTNLEWCTRGENEWHKWNVLYALDPAQDSACGIYKGPPRRKKPTGPRLVDPWNKGKPFPNPKAVAVRRANHDKFCLQLLAELDDGATRKELAAKYGKCYRQICDNLKRARELRGVA